MRALILAGGDQPDPRALDASWPGWSRADLVIGADGGARAAAPLGLPLHLVIGDFDTLTDAEVAQFAARGVRVERAPVEKDATDTELALLAALSVVELTRFVGRTNAELRRFLDSARNDDFSTRYPEGTLDAGFGETGIIETAERLKVRPVEGGNLSTDLTEYTFQGAWASDRVVETKRDAMTRTLAAYAKLYRFVHKAEAKDAFMKAYAGALKSGTTEDAESMWTFVQKYKPYAENLVLTPERIRYMQQLNVDTEVQKAVLPFERVADVFDRGALVAHDQPERGDERQHAPSRDVALVARHDAARGAQGSANSTREGTRGRKGRVREVGAPGGARQAGPRRVVLLR